MRQPLTLTAVSFHIGRTFSLGANTAPPQETERQTRAIGKVEIRSSRMHVAKRGFFRMVLLIMAGMIGTIGMMAVTAWAHRDRGPNDPCRKTIGASLLHLTLYQPHFDPDAEYCEELPRAGKTVVVVDVTEGELRQAPISVEVVAVNAAGESRSVLRIPPQVYPRGVADSEMVFEEGNNYLAHVTVDLGAGKEPQLLSFPIGVTAWYVAMVKPALMVVGVLAFIGISFIRYQITSRQQQSSVGRVKVRRVAH